MIEKYYNEDKTAIGVLISPEYGSGWSTWMYNHDVAIDKRVIEAWQKGISADAMKEFLVALGYEDVYIGSAYYDLKLEWVPIGQKYYIYEYDGYEHLITEDIMETA